MAERNFLVEGLSGAGKSSVYDQLILRGYTAISTDRAWKSRVDPTRWDHERALRELERPQPDVLFVCGSSADRDRFLPYFAGIFNLRIDDDTMRRRLETRTNNDYGKAPEELELMLRLNRSGAKPPGAIDIDAMQPLRQVVDEVLRLANCPTERSDSPPPPWSRGGSSSCKAVVITEPDLPAAGVRPEDLATVAIDRVDFSWSGDLLTTLVSYLEDEGIDLSHSPLSDDSALVLTTGERDRHLARLDPAAFDGTVLRRYYEASNRTEAVGVEYAMLHGIAFLRDTLSALRPGTVAVVVRG